MITVKLVGHQDAFALADVLRLFFGTVTTQTPDCLMVGDESWVISSENRQALQHATAGLHTAFDVQVVTRLWLDQAALDQNQPPFLIFDQTVQKTDARRELKRQLYLLLERITDVHFPWGSLTGVRPTMIAEKLTNELKDLPHVRHDLIERWRLSGEKADLLIRTNLTEQRVLAELPLDEPLIYAGIPFCPSRCAYCSFIAQDAHHKVSWLEPYVDAMLVEARQTFSQLKVTSSAFYLGGGTPTSLPAPLLQRLLVGLKAILPLHQHAEITVEAGRPDTISAEKLQILKDFGTTRICINPQTFHDKTLQKIGRQHSVDAIYEAMAMARSFGFDHINMDLIAGLPGETPADFAVSIDKLLALAPESATVHTLAMKRSSRLFQESDRQDRDRLLINHPDPALMTMVAYAQERLIEAGLHPYYLYRQKDVAGGLENVGFSSLGHECRYNVGMMSDRRAVIGLGSGAISKRVDGTKVTRAPNDKDIAHYIGRLDELIQRKIKLFLN
ncbi:MAG: coproporphyrinogen dehydrogenase HemZ [Eubacteriales bacterium]|nr:coproporphyrinogen dehydrogenase HemZ [Eubacteriales bacterium]